MNTLSNKIFSRITYNPLTFLNIYVELLQIKPSKKMANALILNSTNKNVKSKRKFADTYLIDTYWYM